MTGLRYPFRWDRWDNGWLVGRFPALELGGIPHGVTTRQGPDVQRVAAETMAMGGEVAGRLGLDVVAYATQVHGGGVGVVEQGGLAGEVDALCTNTPGLALVGKSADCPLILLADTTARCVGFAHASWRSTVAGIVPCLVRRMEKTLGCKPENTVACICPSAGPECYEVGPEVREAALAGIGPQARDFLPLRSGRLFFDLWAANTDALVRCGIPREQVFCSGICTLCHNDLLPSFRREGAGAGRFMAIIGLPAAPK